MLYRCFHVFLLLSVLVFGTSGCGVGGPVNDVFSVTGVVTNEDGQGLSGITLIAGSRTDITDPDGRYQLSELKGAVTIAPEPEAEALFYPRQQTVMQPGGEIKAFVRIETRPVAAPQEVPDHGLLGYPGMIMEAVEAASLSVTVSAVDEPPHIDGMTTAGAVYQFDWEQSPDAAINLRFLLDTEDYDRLGIFHLLQNTQEWAHIETDIRDGYLHGRADRFSHYGVFAAEQTAPPEAEPPAGEISRGSAIALKAADNASIYFTTDGTTPTTESPMYTPDNPVHMGEDDITIKALAAQPNHRTSSTVEFRYTPIADENDDDGDGNDDGDDDGNDDDEPGDPEHEPIRSFTAGHYDFDLMYVPGGGVPDSSSMWTPHARHIYLAETLVTYELWDTVRQWGEDHGYTFVNSGRQGGAHTLDAWGNEVAEDPVGNPRHPVTTISWSDAIVWCNALSEMTGLAPVYHNQDDELLRSSELSNEDLQLLSRHQTDGFRLPRSVDWESAARYRDEADERPDSLEFMGRKWTPEDYASGALASVDDEAASAKVAWFGTGFMDFDATTKPVAQLRPNELGLYDMSGLVWEWTATFDSESVWYGRRDYVVRGGSWQYGVTNTQVGFRTFSISSTRTLPDLGFRVSQAIH